MSGTPDERLIFGLLGVDETARWEEVRRAYRDAVRASHPDLNGGDADAERRVKTLNAAWERVNTSSKWLQYVARPTLVADAGPRHAVPILGRLRVQRQRRGSAGLRQWQLELDGTVVGAIANGADRILQAEPGRHSLRVFYDRYSSPLLSVGLQRGEELHLGCRQDSNPFLSLTAPKRSLVLELLSHGRFA